MPTVQGTDDFGHGTVTAPPYDFVFGVPTIITSPVYPNGGVKTLSVVTTGGNIGVRYNITGTPARGWNGFAFRLTADWVQTQFATIGALAGNGPRLAINVSRQLYGFFTGGGAASTPSATLDLDTWYWIEMIANMNPTTRTCNWQLNGSDMGSFSKSGETASTAEMSQLLSYSGDPTGGTLLFGYWEWGLAANDTDWLGEPAAPSAEQTFMPIRRRG